MVKEGLNWVKGRYRKGQAMVTLDYVDNTARYQDTPKLGSAEGASPKSVNVF